MALIFGQPANRAFESALARGGVTRVEHMDDPDEVGALVSRLRPDLLVGPPSLNGWGWVRQAKERLPSLRVVVVGGGRDPERIESALRAGATAYVVAGASEDDLAVALRQSFERSVYLQPEAAPAQAAAVKLTRRETQILTRVADGLSNGEIARELWLTEQTIKFHLSNIFKKLGVRNRTSASRWAHQHGLTAEA